MKHRSWRLVRGLSSLALILAAALIDSPAASGAPCDFWNIAGTGNWSNAANWASGVPNSAGTNVCISNGTGTANLDIAVNIAALSLATGNVLNFNNNTSLTVNGATIVNAGAINMKSTGNVTDLILAGSTTLSGAGTLSLSNTAANRIYGAGAGSTLINQQTIQGSGEIGANLMNLNNQGTVNANQSASLTIDAIGTTNTGTLEATGGGTLTLSNTFSNSGGTILASGAGAQVLLNGSTINSGTLTTASGAFLSTSGAATLNGVTISSGSTYTAPNNTATTLAAGTITNNGVIALSSIGNLTDLVISGTNAGTVTLTGPGSVTMSNTTANRIYGGGAGDTLINQQTIQGSGQIGVGLLTLNNQGVINANQSASLTLNPVSATNSATIEATAGGTLVLSTAITNTGSGNILSTGSGSTVNLSNATINGGSLTTASGGVLQNASSATLNGVTITSGSTFTALNNTTTNLAGTITNNGTFAQNSGGNVTDVIVAGTVTLTGPGVYTMSNTSANRIFGGSAADILVNQQVIQGAGVIGRGQLTLDNQGVINANQSASLTLNPVSASNSATIEATAGGTLVVSTAITNTGSGNILSTGSGSTVNLSNATINGGSLTTASGGVLQNTSTATLNGVTISSGSTFTALNNTATNLAGTITNNGTFAQNSGGNVTDVTVAGTVTLAGSGVYTMSNTSANRIFGGSTADILVNQQVIQGAGQIGLGLLTLNNSATIDANRSQALTITGPVTNTGILEATAGGTLNLAGTFTNTSGTVLSTGASSVNLGGSTINGGSLTTASGGVIINNGTATLNGVTITTGSTVTGQNNTSTHLNGTITNNGTIAINSVGNLTEVVLDGNVILQGGGTVALSNVISNRIYGSGFTLTNQDNTIQGAGQVGAGLTRILNNGTILANDSAILFVTPSALGLTNNGTLAAAAGSLMHVQGGPFSNFSGNTLTGGTYDAAGILQIDQLGGSGGEIVQDAANIILSGSGSIKDSGFLNALSSLSTILSPGSLTLKNGANFTSGGLFSNAGFLDIFSGDAFATGGGAAYTQSGGTTQVDGSLTAGNVNVNGGVLKGTGTIIGNVNVNGGAVAPGDSPGQLTVNGNYMQTASGALDIAIGGAAPGTGYSVLNVNGGVTLSGLLALMSVNGFNPVAGESFFVLDFTGARSGGFTSSTWANLQAGLTYNLVYNSHSVEVDVSSGTSPAPEPSTTLLLAAGLVGVWAMWGRRFRLPAGRAI